ncbi:hypothetical protein ACFQZS_03750 [Mucilaginibacter calamicampi]|uniref:Uncharacterized protein n=1 Tax=Mucilaginibacter calamicampi TaxID=1302352 RepID=A0ABW2YS59_9SPHI
MKNILSIILTIISLNSYGQILEMPLSSQLSQQDTPFPPSLNKDGTFNFDKRFMEKESKIAAWPNQKIVFNIKIRSSGHQIFICDTSGRVLYCQRKSKGTYKTRTSSSYRYFIIYDVDKLKNKNFVEYNLIDDFNRAILFGEGNKIDGIVEIKASKG